MPDQAPAMTAPQSWPRRLFTFPVVLAAALMATMYFFAVTRHTGNTIITDPDIWWHLSNARQLFATGHFIRQDIHSFTAAGQPWINFEWGAELPYYFAYKWFGDRGIFLVMIACSEAIVLGIFLLCYQRSRDVKAAFLASWIAVLMTTASLGPRTLLFGWLLLIAELAILWSFRNGRDRTWLLPPLFMLWINTHGSWFIGLVLMLVFVASCFISARWGDIHSTPWTSAQRRKLILVAAASCAAVFVNPYGWRLVDYPLDLTFKQPLVMKFFNEWATLDFHAARGKLVLLLLLSLGILTLMRRRPWQLSDLLFTLIAIYGAVTYTRFVFLAGILICPLLAIDLRGLLGGYDPKSNKPALNAFALAALAAIVFLVTPSPAILHEGLAETYPEQALPRLRQLPPDARMLNFFEWGGYLMWHNPQLPLFIDGRTDIFIRGGIMQDYADALMGDRVPEVLDKYRIQYVLFPNHGPLPNLLAHDPQWKLTWQDTHTLLFERAAAQ